MTDFNAMTDALVACDAARLTDLVNKALADNVKAGDILNKGLIAGMDVVGERMESGLRDQVKILVGGAPVTQAFAMEIGADGFAADAGSASKLAKALVS